MPKQLIKPSIKLLRNKIDYTKVPFSDRGSRLLVFLTPFKSKFYIKLAERLTSIDPSRTPPSRLEVRQRFPYRFSQVQRAPGT